jgi:hypothetical protein
VGRDYTGNYWYIRNPNQSGGFCWLWGEYATVTGNWAVLPQYTPPPTPTPMPAFEAFYDGLDTCVGWWVDIELDNIGGLPFRSISLTVRDTETDATVSMYADGFTNIDGCLDRLGRMFSILAIRIISAAPLPITPLTMNSRNYHCVQSGQNGTCVTEVIEFTRREAVQGRLEKPALFCFKIRLFRFCKEFSKFVGNNPYCIRHRFPL